MKFFTTWTKIFFSSCFIIFFFVVGFLGFFSELSKLQGIEVQINKNLENEKFYLNLRKKINNELASYKGKSIWSVRLKEINDQFKKSHPFLDIRIFRKLPNRIIIFIRKNLSSAILLKENIFYSISHDGKIQNKILISEFSDLPILRGKVFSDNVNLRKQIIQIFLLLSNPKDILNTNNISEIIYNKKHKSFILFLSSNNLSIEAQADLSKTKIKNINFILNYMIQRKKEGYLLDSRFDKKIIVKKHH